VVQRPAGDSLMEGMTPPHTFVLFGATGDLARRKLLPALYNLYAAGFIPEPWLLVCVARTAQTDDSYRDQARKAVETYGRQGTVDSERWRQFSRHLHYVAMDASDPAAYRTLAAKLATWEQEHGLPGHRIFYLAMAPKFFGTVTTHLDAAGLTRTDGFKRLIIEKPFGRDLRSAEQLNEQIRRVFDESEIYRIDHYLGKEMVQNIEVIRFANSLFEPVWNYRSIANVQITSSETVGVEDRAAYYDEAGALRDMVQNHMLQMVMMVAMEPPSRLETEAIRDEKVKVLRSLRRYRPEEVGQHVVRGQYVAGTIGSKPARGYRAEHGVDPKSETETFVAARLYVDNFRWAGVPFYIRTGKRMAAKATEIVIQFRDMPKHLYFNESGNLGPNLLVIRVNPIEGMYLRLYAKRPGSEEAVVPVAMEYSQAPNQSPEAYERLLHDAMRGDSTFFTRWDEVSLAWKWVDPIAQAFRENRLPLESYPAGSWGPQAAEDLLHQDGYHWWPVYGQDTSSVDDVPERQYGQAREVR
jgi:glucose-6-phosphate 1-dehydrogenase